MPQKYRVEPPIGRRAMSPKPPASLLVVRFLSWLWLVVTDAHDELALLASAFAQALGLRFQI